MPRARNLLLFVVIAPNRRHRLTKAEEASMAMGMKRDEWMAKVVGDAAQREREFEKASSIELIFSLMAAAWAVIAFWGFTAATVVLGGIGSEAVGGIAVLCFSACMAIAAGGGIKKRFIALVIELDARPG